MTITTFTPGLSSSLLPVGSIVAHAGPTTEIPIGWLLCDGSAVSRSTYQALFAAVQTTWGAGDGVTTFNLPNLNDRYAYGANVGSAGSSTNTHNHNASAMSVSLGVIAGGDQSHSHAFNINAPAAGGVGSHNHNLNLGWNSGNSNSNAAKATGTTQAQGSAHDHNSSAGWTAATDSHSHTGNTPGNTGNTGYGNHSHWTNTTINADLTQGNAATNTSGNHELANIQTLVLIKT